jgi:AcrR family transcriptional regulator
MAKAKIHPSADLMLRVDRAFLDHGYSELTMRGLAKVCDFSTRALYYYFSSKEEAFRASIQYHNDLALGSCFEAGRAQRADGGDALDIIAAIMNNRFGETRRRANASRHIVELHAEVFKRCNDIITTVALVFEEELAKLVVELEGAGMFKLRRDVTPEQAAQALANGARGVNQRLPPVPPDELAERYREMCRFIIHGCTEMPERRPQPKRRALAASLASGKH